MIFVRHFFLTILFMLFFVQVSLVWGQNNRLENFIKAGPEDSEALTRAYLKPYPTGIGGTMNTGWFNSASTHRLFGFDIQIRGGLAIVPTSDQEFDVEDLNLERVELANGEPTSSPTGAGKDEKGPLIRVRDEGGTVAIFNLPQGSGFSYVPAPLVQASVGLIKNTDLSVRFVPKIKMGDYVDYNMKGIGVKHSVSQWISGDNALPVDISVFAGYNHIDITAKFDLDPPQPDPSTNYDNQRVYIDFDTFAAKLAVGKDLKFLSLYGALGYETSTMNLDATGNYPVIVSGPGDTPTTETLTDPFSYKEDGKNRYSASGGVTVKLSSLRIFGEFTLAEYPVANAGIGFSFR